MNVLTKQQNSVPTGKILFPDPSWARMGGIPQNQLFIRLTPTRVFGLLKPGNWKCCFASAYRFHNTRQLKPVHDHDNTSVTFLFCILIMVSYIFRLIGVVYFHPSITLCTERDQKLNLRNQGCIEPLKRLDALCWNDSVQKNTSSRVLQHIYFLESKNILIL